MKLIKNVRLDGRLVDVAVKDGKIFDIIGNGLEKYGDASAFDFGGARIFPGLIDIHSHGARGMDTMDGDTLERLADYYLSCGVTTWYPTTMTMSKDDIIRATDAPLPAHGANVPGFHLEGPFISPKKCGAQDPGYATLPSLEYINGIKNVKLITVAPELDGALEFIESCSAVVCIGHTTADYDTSRAAFLAGAKCLTHTFNAMPSIHHRDPGPILAGAETGAYAQLICDGIHVHPSVVRMLVKLYGTDRVILISDSISATGLSDGEYLLGGQKVFMKSGVVTLDGTTLAGSSVNLFECVRRAISFGILEGDAVKMASENPARLMGLNKGVIEKGYDADFIIVNDDFELIKAIVRGEID